MLKILRKINCAAAALLLGGCTKCAPTISTTAEQRVSFHGVTYHLPIDPSGIVSSGQFFEYRSSSLVVGETNAVLFLNGTNYGNLKEGDRVSIDNRGVVQVNGSRRPAKAD
jgi:hypothetical protein